MPPGRLTISQYADESRYERKNHMPVVGLRSVTLIVAAVAVAILGSTPLMADDFQAHYTACTSAAKTEADRRTCADTFWSEFNKPFSSTNSPAVSCAGEYTPPRLLFAPIATTPPLALQQGINGEVQIALNIDSRGQQTGLSVDSSASVLLNTAALDASRLAKFQAATQNCLPVPRDAKLLISFAGSGAVTISLVSSDRAAQSRPIVATTELDGPSATAICRTRIIEAAYLNASDTNGSQAKIDAFITKAEADGSAQEAVANGDGSIERTVDDGDAGYRVEIANCLVRLNRLADARKLLTLTYHDFHGSKENNGVVSTSKLEVARQLALVEQRLGLHAAALAHISIACPNCEDDADGIHLSSDPWLSDSISADFKRIAAQKIRTAANARILQSKGFWSALSADQRDVVKGHGGSQLDVMKGYPCHVETYDAGGYHQETWWYGCDADGYYEGDTFLNGKLTSTYSP
jgi:TonB family protein